MILNDDVYNVISICNESFMVVSFVFAGVVGVDGVYYQVQLLLLLLVLVYGMINPDCVCYLV